MIIVNMGDKMYKSKVLYPTHGHCKMIIIALDKMFSLGPAKMEYLSPRTISQD